MLVRRCALAALGVFLACRPAVSPDASGLDRHLLAAIDGVLAPLPRFSGAGRGLAELPNGSLDGCSTARRPGAAAWHADLPDLARAVARQPATGGEEPRILRERALGALLEGTPLSRERAVQLMRLARGRDGSPARRNDLAAALLIQAGYDDRPAGFAAALEELSEDAGDRVSATDEAILNRALALRCLTLWEEAAAVSRRARLASREPLRAKAPAGQLADAATRRRRGEWLLGEWGRCARGEGGSRCGELLAKAASIGAEVERRGGDPMLRQAAEQVTAAARRDPRQLALLADGHAAFHSVRGDAIYSRCDVATLQHASASLAAAGSPFAEWVRLDQSVCDYFARDFPSAEAILNGLVKRSSARGWLALQSRARWIRGLLYMVQGRFVEAVRDYGVGIDLFAHLGENGHVAYLHSLRAKAYELGGARDEAWHERLTALRHRNLVADPERRFTIFQEAAQALRRQGYPEAALGFLSEQMRAAEASRQAGGSGDTLAFTLLDRADLLSELARYAPAARDVAAAAQIAGRLSICPSRERLRVKVDVRQAAFEPDPSRRHELAALDRGIEYFAGKQGALGDQIELLALELRRSQVDLQRGDPIAARDDLLHGVDEIERQRLDLASPEERARYIASARGVFANLIALQLDRLHDPAAALETLERSTNRELKAAMRPPRSGLASALTGVPGVGRRSGYAMVVRLAHLRDRVLLWTITAGSLQLEQRRIVDTELTDLLERCRGSLRSGTGGDVQSCDRLAGVLLPTRLRELAVRDGDPPVLVIPDELIGRVPLAALRWRSGGPLLVERLRMSYAATLGAATVPPSPSPSRLSSALFVADPAFDRALYPRLPRLPAARAAAAEYARNYGSTAVLADRSATVPAVAAALSRFEVFEFDGHSISNSQYPERGGLLMATTGEGGSALLRPADLEGRPLGRLRLVLLGACSSGLTTYAGTSEVTGLAAALLASGVPEVVVASWEVDDREAAELLRHFHRALAAGVAADAALQTAQLAALRQAKGAQHAGTWAAFQVLRGGA